MAKVDLQESIEFPGFYHVPTIEDVLVSREGKVIELTTMFCPLIKYNPNSSSSYPHVNLPGSNTRHIHRLLALTFLDCPGDPADYHVNHIDGVKSNNDLNNLEWVNASENCIHAYSSGLRSDNRPVLMKDLRTDRVKRFNSLQETARWFGCNASIIYRYLNTDEIVPFQECFTLIYEGESWKPLSIADVGRKRKGSSKPVLVEYDDGALAIYSSLGHAASEFGMSWNLVAYYATGKHRVEGRNFSLYYAQDYIDSIEDAVVVADTRHRPVSRHLPKRKPIPVNVTDLSSGIKEWWESVEAFARSVGMSKNTVQKSMNKKNGVWRNYLIEYCTKVYCPPSE